MGLSAVNLTGGTIVTKKMLDMFRRKDDAPEFNEYYLLPGVVAGKITTVRYLIGGKPNQPSNLSLNTDLS